MTKVSAASHCVDMAQLSIRAIKMRRAEVNSAGGRWTHRMVNMLLRNEKYIGNNVWNRTSFKLQTKHLRNSPDMWLRADCSFEAIIDRPLFDAAEAIFSARAQLTCRGRRRGLSDDEMLEALRLLWLKHGYLTVAIIESSNGVPCSAYIDCGLEG